MIDCWVVREILPGTREPGRLRDPMFLQLEYLREQTHVPKPYRKETAEAAVSLGVS